MPCLDVAIRVTSDGARKLCFILLINLQWVVNLMLNNISREDHRYRMIKIHVICVSSYFIVVQRKFFPKTTFTAAYSKNL